MTWAMKVTELRIVLLVGVVMYALPRPAATMRPEPTMKDWHDCDNFGADSHLLGECNGPPAWVYDMNEGKCENSPTCYDSHPFKSEADCKTTCVDSNWNTPEYQEKKALYTRKIADWLNFGIFHDKEVEVPAKKHPEMESHPCDINIDAHSPTKCTKDTKAWLYDNHNNTCVNDLTCGLVDGVKQFKSLQECKTACVDIKWNTTEYRQKVTDYDKQMDAYVKPLN